jgi:hypothetical protein
MYSSGNALGLSRPCKRSAALATLLPAVLCVCFLPFEACAKYDGGAGTEASPYLIRTAQQMNDIGASPGDWNKHFRLAADLDMSNYTGAAYNIIGTSTTQPFSGVFDGSNHEIFDFSVTTTQEFYTGLFGCVSGKIENMGLVKPFVLAHGSRVGALVGYLDHGQVTSCYNRGGSVSGADDVGGLIGRSAGRIFKSYSSGTVSGDAYVGGLIGLITDEAVTTSFSTADVSGTRNVGGLVGKTADEQAAVSNSYATGSVTGNSYVGGLVGQVERGAAHRSYSAGSVSGSQFTGGLTGYVRVLGRVSNSVWDTETSGQADSGGGIGKTTAEMQTISTFTDTGWDFWSTWTMCEGMNYPIFFWQIPATDYQCPDGVDYIDFAFFARRWHRQGCGPGNGNCEGADVDGSGTVDFSDFEIFAARWLAGVK